MKHFLIGLMLIFILLGLLFYTNMFHLACVISFLLAILAGTFFTLSLTKQHTKSLERQEYLRKQLTSDVAHEIRTPLAAVSAHLEAMMIGVWEPTPERLQSCCDELKRMSLLVTDLERIDKAENDNFALNKEKIELFELAQGILAKFEREAANKNLKLDITGEPAFITANKDRISQVIINLLSNALKYTPPGGKVEVYIKDMKGYALITIEDSGSGIADKELPFIFERFYRIDKSRSADTGGRGLGLAIVKAIVDAHGGELEVKSKEGEGSAFTVKLPI